MLKTTKAPEIYHNTMGEAIEAARQYATDKGYTVGDHMGFDWTSMAYETYQTRLYQLTKNDKHVEKCLNVTLYRMPSGKYELVTYVN